FFSFSTPLPPTPTLFPYTTLFRSCLSSIRFSRPCIAPPSACGKRNKLIDDRGAASGSSPQSQIAQVSDFQPPDVSDLRPPLTSRSEEHTSELQSRENLVCRLLLEK